MSIWQILLLIGGIILIALVILYFVGRNMQKKQDDANVRIEAMRQTVSMLIIDKKMLKVTKSGLPQVAIDQVPFYMRWQKMPIVKAKVGPRIMTLAAEKNVWDVLPVKQEVKVDISGIYITGIKSVRGGSVKPVEKKKFMDRFKKKKNEKK